MARPSSIIAAVAEERPEERFVRGLLEDNGFEVERVAEATIGKRADYRARSGQEVYLVEVKQIREALLDIAPGQVAFWDIPLEYRNVLAGTARNASKQLLATPSPTADPIRMAWFVATGVEADAYVDQLRATLYGAVELIWEIEDGAASSKRCYFFSFAEFFRSTELDAVVIGTSERGQFCLNPFSRQAQQVRSCSLAKIFGDGLVDPEKEGTEGSSFVADFSGDRRDENAMLEAVKKKYGLDFLITFKPTRHSAATFVQAATSDSHRKERTT